MMKFRLSCIVVSLIFAFSVNGYAQFKSEAFTQQYNDDKTSIKDSVDKVFSFKEYFGALGHKNEMKVGTMFAGSLIFVGGCQIYNKDYWKLPITYTGIGLGIAGGICHQKIYGRQDLSTWSYVLAGLTYWGTLMDGVIRYQPNDFPQPGKATIYSILLPGLGQIYNKEYWKVPIYVGGMVAAGHFWALNQRNYIRYRDIYKESGLPDYSGPISSEQALYYRDVYRRWRDYSILAMALVYVLQIIDANVFAYMHDFEVKNDLAVSVRPSVIYPEYNSYASAAPTSFGLSVGLKF